MELVITHFFTFLNVGFSCENATNVRKKLHVFKASITLMLLPDISSRCVSDLVGCLLMEVRFYYF